MKSASSSDNAAETNDIFANIKITEVPRVLTATDLLLLGIGGIIGAGIFVLSGQAAAKYAGPAIVISFILAGTCCVFYGLCYAELAAMVPVAGSAYTYAKVAFGRFTSWVIGWNLLLEYLFGAATVSVGWSGYLVSCLKDANIVIPPSLTSPVFELDGDMLVPSGAVGNVPAAFLVLMCTVLLCFGIRESTKINNVVVACKLIVLLMFVTAGSFFVKPENYEPFIPPNTGEFGKFGWSGVVRGSSVVLFAYLGFDSLTTVASETIDAQRNLPIGILGALGVCTFLYVCVAAVLTGLVPYKDLLVPDPMAVGIDAAGPDLFWMHPFVKLGALFGLTSVVLVNLMAQPRIIQIMAVDGLVPSQLGEIHPRYMTPHIATIACGCSCAFIAFLLPIGILGELVSIGTLLAFFIVCVGVISLRRTHPDAPRPFKVPFAPYVPGLGAILALGQMCFLPTSTWLRLGVWMLLGLVVYYFHGRRNAEYVAVSPDDDQPKSTEHTA